MSTEYLHLHRMTKTRLFVTLTAALPVLACGTPGGGGGAASDSSAVLQASQQYVQAWIRGDTTAALGRISHDIRILISGVPDVVGAEATRKLFADEMGTYDVPLLKLHHDDLFVSGDHAIDIGTYEEIQMPKKGGPPIQGRGRFMTIWRREGGEWRIRRYMLNDLPVAK
jgi:ketosteroid isomerase-like protein